mmetsp:Transcript_6609/g.23433  ORF Transcript_6609/g.23433 Transcript_6609/m.23433 type:complete len:220 (+) Transcript_6609:801-1460(+)
MSEKATVSVSCSEDFSTLRSASVVKDWKKSISTPAFAKALASRESSADVNEGRILLDFVERAAKSSGASTLALVKACAIKVKSSERNVWASFATKAFEMASKSASRPASEAAHAVLERSRPLKAAMCCNDSAARASSSSLDPRADAYAHIISASCSVLKASRLGRDFCAMASKSAGAATSAAAKAQTRSETDVSNEPALRGAASAMASNNKAALKFAEA